MTPVWQARRSLIGNNRGEILAIAADGQALTAKQVLHGWRSNEAFRDLFIAELTASPYAAFFWEMPAVSRETLPEPFECAVIRSEVLAAMRADESDFAEHLISAEGSVTSFANVSGDALLIAPKRVSAIDCYAHIAAFLREGPRKQQHALFQLLAAQTETLLDAGRKFWISTSGLGVPWVHVRLDSHPKYYQYRPYTER